jgi:hypothetical protein
MSTPPASGGGPIGVRRVELAGVLWTVREARPASVTAQPPPLVLVFDSGIEQRQLSPVPARWTEWTDAQLQEACLRAATSVHTGVDFMRARGS